jgi:hypothetical protein
MARSGRGIGSLVAILLWISSGSMFSQQLFCEVSLNKSSVYVGEPVEVKISVFTSTWFTRGIDLGNIKVNGAFSVYARPVSTSVVREGQTYSGVQLIYNVFPYSEKDLVFPSLDIAVETPPEGGYKGERRVIKSPEKRIRVKPIPAGFSEDDWLVTKGLSISDNWQGDLKNVKVGDVLVRRITRVAQGTVSELIPPVQWDSIAGVSLYKTRGSVENNKSRTDISATRVESMRFLFEQEGEVVLPALVFNWYDPVQKQLFKRTLNEMTIQVQPNPDLGVLESVRDSLFLAQEEDMQESEGEEAMRILGLSPGGFAVVLLLGIIFAFVLSVLIRRLARFIQARREAYRKSEAYYFRDFKRAARGQDLGAATQALYRWIDELHLQEPSIAYFVKRFGTRELQKEALKMTEGDLKSRESPGITFSQWQQARKKYLAMEAPPSQGQVTAWINPA